MNTSTNIFLALCVHVWDKIECILKEEAMVHAKIGITAYKRALENYIMRKRAHC